MVTTCYLYDHIPGAHVSWTLAVFAISRKDADDYMKVQHHGGKYAGTVTSGEVKAHCGATTAAASAEIRRANHGE